MSIKTRGGGKVLLVIVNLRVASWEMQYTHNLGI